MYLPDLLQGLRRRWWAVLLGLMGTAFLVWTAAGMVPVDRVANASVLVLPPNSTVGTGGNPYLALGGLAPAADVLATAMNNGTLHEQLAPAAGTSTFVVSRDFNSSGPMLLVEVTDPDAGTSLALLDKVLAQMPATFEELQSRVDVPADSRLSLSVVTRDDIAQASAKSQIRAVLMAGIAGLALTVFGTKLLDAALVRRRARRDEAAAAVPLDTPGDSPAEAPVDAPVAAPVVVAEHSPSAPTGVAVEPVEDAVPTEPQDRDAVHAEPAVDHPVPAAPAAEARVVAVPPTDAAADVPEPAPQPADPDSTGSHEDLVPVPRHREDIWIA